MSRFFDRNTHRLHVVRSYAGAVKLPSDIVRNTVKIKELDPNTMNIDEVPTLKLRRQYANTAGAEFFSMEDRKIHQGCYDTASNANADLIKIAETVVYR